MARLNEPPMSSDSFESLRRKMLRQNRDLAKSNNVRALRIRELENDCACMLSENLQLRGRILELEQQAEDNEARRVADHALAIKAKLEAQLTEWGDLLAGLGLEPPMKKHSPRARSSTKPRLSFSSMRPSPSQRRLRDVARDIEELGHIAENKLTHPRMSLNPDQILALRSEADSSDDAMESPDLGPPPISQFIDADPVKIDSPARTTPNQTTKIIITDEETLPVPIKLPTTLSSPQSIVKVEEVHEMDTDTSATIEEDKPSASSDSKPTRSTKSEPVGVPTTTKAGAKRKHGARDEPQGARTRAVNNENQPPKTGAEKPSIRDRADGKTLKEMTQIRKEARERPIAPRRRPLAAKSTNNDVSSPQKSAGKPTDKPQVASVKISLQTANVSNEMPKSKPAKADITTNLPLSPSRPSLPPSDLATPVGEPGLLSPNTPEPMKLDGARGDTPPPADITSEGETSRPSRRNRTAVSYAEPNLRDKMRRPSKQLFDAVAGEGKYSRRSSHSAPLAQDGTRIKRESDAGELLQQLPCADTQTIAEPDVAPTDNTSEGVTPSEAALKTTVAERSKRQSSTTKSIEEASPPEPSSPTDAGSTGAADTTGEEGETDPYEFTVSSPLPEKSEVEEPKRRASSRASRSSRRFSSMADGDATSTIQERSSSRRRSMML
jgi:hypothetical protein